MKAIILAGGKGSRFKPITDTIPKALLPITDSTLIERTLDTLPDSIDHVIITLDYLGNLIQEKIGSAYKNKKIDYSYQDKEKKGTWAALYSAKEYIEKDEYFCVLNCDDLFSKAELTYIINSKKVGIGITKTIMPAKYHGVKITPDGYFKKLERHPNENREELLEDTFTNGFFLLTGEVFYFEAVSLIDGELGLPQTLFAHPEYPLFAHKMNYWQPCNTPEDLKKIKGVKQITKTLPRSAWEYVEIQENNEPMVSICETNKIIFSSYTKEKSESTHIRKSVLEKLELAVQSLPENYQLVIIEGYRSVASQQKSWDRMWDKIKTASPELSDIEIEKRVRLYVAKPSRLANHNCGGAIDVTLTYNGTPIDMGTKHPNEEDDVSVIKKFPMFSESITQEQIANRALLRNTMTMVGFVYYPEEWWHYCWGDRMWAVYTNQEIFFYGPVELNI